uniref:Uncharacterized protein n=1 Tax=Lygus hesperus TaxID=30085 RepID=A0A146LIG5_LYGHE
MCTDPQSLLRSPGTATCTVCTSSFAPTSSHRVFVSFATLSQLLSVDTFSRIRCTLLLHTSRSSQFELLPLSTLTLLVARSSAPVHQLLQILYVPPLHPLSTISATTSSPVPYSTSYPPPLFPQSLVSLFSILCFLC